VTGSGDDGGGPAGGSGDEPAFPATRHAVEPGCDRCPALVDCRTRIAWGTGPTDADLFVVGEAPATGDPDADRWRGGNHTGRAYTSRHSGRRIRRVVAELGYAGRAYYTNAVKCVPCAGDGDGGTRAPTDAELAACREHLAAELDRVSPAVVCPTGKHATRSVLALAGRTDALDGFLDAVLEPRRVGLGAPVVPLLHPSYRDVWRARLGYDDGEYVAAVEETLRRLVGNEGRAGNGNENEDG
jgi:uracil-DNA glycosylase family 4